MIDIEIFPASYGDCFLVRCIDDDKETKINILIDCGFVSTYTKYLKPRLQELGSKGEVLDLVVVTHIDEDHITGIIKLLRDNGKLEKPKIIPIKEIWHNGFKQMHFQHLLTEKYSEQEKTVLELFVSNSQQDKKDIENVNASHSTSLIDEIYRGNYQEIWNSTVKAGEITVENLSLKTIEATDDFKIILLGPSKNELQYLDNYCINEFEEKVGLDFKLKDDKFIVEKVWEMIILNDRQEREAGFTPISNTISEIKDFVNNQELSEKELEEVIKKINRQKIKEDKSKPNRSSITFILEYQDKKVLFLGDTAPSVVIERLFNLSLSGYDLYFDAIKISHHGSNKNTSQKLLNMIDSEHFIISTNGFSHNHPDVETIIWIVSRDLKHKKRKIIFNYKTEVSELMKSKQMLSFFDNTYEVIEVNPDMKVNNKARCREYILSLK